MEKAMKVVALEPGKLARIETIDGSLKGMQNYVGGLIQEIMPFEDDVAIICNDEGKLLRLPMNRGLRAEDGELYDILVGKAFLAYAPPESEEFLDLPDELAEKYLEKFKCPEALVDIGGQLACIPYFLDEDGEE